MPDFDPSITGELTPTPKWMTSDPKSFYNQNCYPNISIGLFREWESGLHPSSSLNHLEQYHNDGDHQQGMNDAAHRVAGQQSHHPQNQQNYKYGPKHGSLLFNV
jgi:hypothetical protein